MNRGLFVCILFIGLSCSRMDVIHPKESKVFYSYTDVSGKYALNRETKFLKKRLVTRSQLIDLKTKKVVEKSVAVSQVGTIKSDKVRLLTVRPLASEFTVWLDGQRHSTSLHISPGTRTMSVKPEGPGGKGPSEVPFPKAKYFCFFSQIPECLYHSHFLHKSHHNPKRTFSFYVVWDSWPYVQEQFTGIGKELFSLATLKFDGEMKKTLRFMVELEGQAVLYHFSSSYDLVKMAWIAQGITIVPPGEGINEEQ